METNGWKWETVVETNALVGFTPLTVSINASELCRVSSIFSLNPKLPAFIELYVCFAPIQAIPEYQTTGRFRRGKVCVFRKMMMIQANKLESTNWSYRIVFSAILSLSAVSQDLPHTINGKSMDQLPTCSAESFGVSTHLK